MPKPWRPLLVISLVMLFAVAATRAAQRLRALDVAQPIGFFIDDGDPRTGFRPADRDLARVALEAWQKTIGPAVSLSGSSLGSARLRVHWAGPRDGQYGEMRPLVVDGRAGAAVFIRPNLDGLGEDVAERGASDPLFRDTVVFLTCVHELGHAFGLEHTSDFRDIMYSFQYGGDIVEYFSRYRRQLKSRDDMARIPPMSAGDVQRVRALYLRQDP